MHKLHFPHYFSHKIRREVDELYASATIADMAIAMILLFEPIYFVTVLGWSLSSVLWFFAGVYFLYILFIPFGAKLIAKKGYEHGMFYSIPFQIGYWLLLFNIPNHPQFVYLAVIFFAIEKSLYWPAFHADLARFSDKDQRGRESSTMWALVQFGYILGPFIGGVVSHHFGVRTLFILASAVYFTMFIPMFATPERPPTKPYKFKETLTYYRKFPREALAHMGFGEELITLVVWPVFIFSLVPNYFSLGSIIAVATLCAALIMLYAGKKADYGQRRKVLVVGCLFAIAVWLGRPFVAGVLGVFIADSLLRIGRDLFYVPITANIYDRANEEEILPYAVFFEQSLSVGKLLASIIGAALYIWTESFTPLFILAALFTLAYLALPSRKRLLSGHMLR